MEGGGAGVGGGQARRRLAVVGASAVALVCGVAAMSSGPGGVAGPVSLEIRSGLSWPRPGAQAGSSAPHSSSSASTLAASSLAAMANAQAKARAHSRIAAMSARLEQAKEAHESVRVQAALAYDADMQTAEQSEKMRTRLQEMERTAPESLRPTLTRARAVLMGGTKDGLEQARSILEDAAAHTQDLAEAPSPAPAPVKRGCMPHCGVIKNVFDGIDTTKYPYDERHGGHMWKKIVLKPSGVDGQYAETEAGRGPEDLQQRRAGGYVWKDLAAKPEKNVWDQPAEQDDGPTYAWHHGGDPRG